MQALEIVKSAIKIKEEDNDKLKNFTCRLPISLLKDVYAIEFNYKMLTSTNLTHNALVKDALKHYIPILQAEFSKLREQ